LFGRRVPAGLRGEIAKPAKKQRQQAAPKTEHLAYGKNPALTSMASLRASHVFMAVDALVR
jgi:hypothetical protein